MEREKKTIGRFIFALRRARGMTQQELGDILFVSDKTVSRWERDESTPDLSLIPAIADLFGVTVDELLRGERRAVEPSSTFDSFEEAQRRGPSSTSQIGDRRFQILLKQKQKRFRMMSLISFGLTVFGIFLGLILCDLKKDVFHNPDIIGFVCTLFFVTASVIVLLCGLSNVWTAEDAGENGADAVFSEQQTVSLREMRIPLIRTSAAVLGTNLVVVVCMIPESWIDIPYLTRLFLLPLILCVLLTVFYDLIIEPLLIRKGSIWVSEDGRERLKTGRRKRVKVLISAVCMSLVGVLALIAVGEIGIKPFLKGTSFPQEDLNSLVEYVNSVSDAYEDEEHPTTPHIVKSLVTDGHGREIAIRYDQNCIFTIALEDRDGEKVYTVYLDADFRIASAVVYGLHGLVITLLVIGLTACAVKYVLLSVKYTYKKRRNKIKTV